MYQNIATKVLTGEVRLSYCNLTTPRAAMQGGEPKYSVTLLIPKTDTATKMDIDNSIKQHTRMALAKSGAVHIPSLKLLCTMVTGYAPPACPLVMSAKAIGLSLHQPKISPRLLALIMSTVSLHLTIFTAVCMPV